MKKRLIVIGNGFDLHSKRKTTYEDFRIYLKNSDEELYNSISGLYPRLSEKRKENWCNFEHELANINLSEINSQLDQIARLSNTAGVAENLRENLSGFYSKLQKSFEKWVSTLKKTKNVYKPRGAFNYLCFNYTDTLRKMYSVKNAITFVHGKIGDKKLIFGHGDAAAANYHIQMPTYVENEWTNDFGNYYQLKIEVEHFGKGFYKDTKKIVQNKQEVGKIINSSYDEVIIIGCSLDLIDDFYFSEIVKRSPKAQYIISYHSIQSSCCEFVKRHNINAYSFFKTKQIIRKYFKIHNYFNYLIVFAIPEFLNGLKKR